MTRRQKARPVDPTSKCDAATPTMWTCLHAGPDQQPHTSTTVGWRVVWTMCMSGHPMENRSDSAKKAGKPAKGLGGQRQQRPKRSAWAAEKRGARGAERGGVAATGLLRAPVTGRGSGASQGMACKAANGCRRPESAELMQPPQARGGCNSVGRAGQCAHRRREGLHPSWTCARVGWGQHLHRCLQMGRGPEM